MDMGRGLGQDCRRRQTMTLDYSKLFTGQSISRRTFQLDSATVRDYVAAVSNAATIADNDCVPPMCLAAMSLRGLIDDLRIPGGTVHAGQELQFLAEVKAGEEVTCDAVLLQNSVRGEWRFLVVELESRDSADQPVLTGKSTIMLPDVSN